MALSGRLSRKKFLVSKPASYVVITGLSLCGKLRLNFRKLEEYLIKDWR